MNGVSSRPGYAFLVTVLVMGVVAAGAVTTLLLLNTTVLRNTATLEAQARAQTNAMSCAERALLSLRSDLGYGGDETLTLTGGAACRILPVEGTGNALRSVCVEAADSGVVWRMETAISAVLPLTKISRWRDVTEFSLCDE